VIDPQSGVAFPVTLAPPGSAGPHQLTGTATRERTIFKVNVYAFGLYVDAEVARKELASFKGKPPEALDHTFYQRLLEMRIPMTMRLVMTRDISGEAIAKAIAPRVQQHSNDSAAISICASWPEARSSSSPAALEGA
jgi:hypothetical protein